MITKEQIKDTIQRYLEDRWFKKVEDILIDMELAVDFLNEIKDNTENMEVDYSIEQTGGDYSILATYYNDTIGYSIIIKYEDHRYRKSEEYIIDLLYNNEQKANELKNRLLILKN